LSFTADELAELERWIKRARPLNGIYYRSVEYRFMDPDEVLNGQGTQLYGGRFAKVGVKAVYLARSDFGASKEVLTRKKRLGGHAQITIDKYPRVVFGVDVALKKVASWARKPRSPLLRGIRQGCLLKNDLSRSQEIGNQLRISGVQGLLFPSAVGGGQNLIVYLENCSSSALKLQNVVELKRKIAEFTKI
jgi:RES domain-containing protein